MVFTRRQWITTGALTAGCFGLYFGLRAMPVEACEVLHYGDYVNAEGVIEGCGYEEVGFFDLEAMRFPLLAELEPLGSVRAGEPATFLLHLHTFTGKAVSYRDLAVSHTERLHAMVVDTTLEDYQHVHPRDGGAPGTFILEFEPQRAGAYQIYFDFIPLQTARRSLVAATVEVAPAEAVDLEAAAGTARAMSGPDDLDVRLVTDADALRAGEEVTFRLEVAQSSGDAPLRFDPIMDSYAHLVAFAPGRTGFAHFHPRDPFIDGQDPLNPSLDFLFAADDPGEYRVWAQFSVNGREHFVPFDLTVAAAS
ncbi:MAG: hypothetical protein ACLFR7_05440 [Opitutales bacterium]